MGIILFIIVTGIIIYFLLRENGANKATNNSKGNAIADKQRDEQIGYLEILNRGLRNLEILRQAKIVGDHDTIDAINNGTYDGPMPEEWTSGTYYNSIYPDKLLIMNIAGINHRSGIKSCIGDFKAVIMPEPKNEFDKYAIKIKHENGKHLGYIAENLTDMVRDFLGHPDAENDTKWKHIVTGHIDEREDDTDYKVRKYYTGFINITN